MPEGGLPKAYKSVLEGGMDEGPNAFALFEKFLLVIVAFPLLIKPVILPVFVVCDNIFSLPVYMQSPFQNYQFASCRENVSSMS